MRLRHDPATQDRDDLEIDRLRLADLMACLAAASELAMGQPAGHAPQVCALALRLAQAAGLRGSELRNVYYQALLRFIGCNADTGEMAAAAGDVLALRRAMEGVDQGDTRRVLATLVRRVRDTHADEPVLAQAIAVVRGVLRAGEFAGEIFPGHCEVAQRLGRRLGFDERFVDGLGQLFARWDGRGVPAVRGERILPAVRVVTLAHELLVHHREGGWAQAAETVRRRRGTQFDPALADLAIAQGPSPLAELDDRWETVIALEPPPHDVLQGPSLEDAFDVLADYGDLQSRWLLGHARRVAALAGGAAARQGMSAAAQRALRCAARAHDIGRVAVSTHVWDRAGPLTSGELEAVRLHPAHTQRILARAGSLASLARLASCAHERMDGSGYGAGGAWAGTRAARLLAAADLVAALGEDRPHRPAHAPEEIARIVGVEASAGRLDAVAAGAVLEEAGLARRMKRDARALPAGLSPREAEVLGLLARGHTNKAIARRLGVSPKTVGHQLESAYRKADVRTRAGATLFAMEHGLVPAADREAMGHPPDAAGGGAA